MDTLLKELIDRLAVRKKNEMAYFMRYQDEESKELLLISSGKMMELDYLIHELKALQKQKSKHKNY